MNRSRLLPTYYFLLTLTSIKKQFIKNVGSGWLAVFVTGLVGFLSLPLNLKHLGTELYGISALAVSTLTLFSFLSMGMQPALLRFFSHAVAEKDREKFKSLSSMAQLLLGGLGFIGAIGFLCTYPWFVAIYQVPENVRRDLFILFLAIAFDFWANLFLIPFTTVIQAGNRFDVGNMQQCLAKVLRIIVLFVGYSFFSPSLLILAASTFAGTFYQLTSLVFLAYRIHGNAIFFHRKSLRWNLLPPLFSFSVWNFISQVSVGLSIQLPMLIIGKTLGVDMVAAFSPAIVLSSFCSTILIQVSAPLVPIASKDIVESGGKNLGRWAIQMGEITASLGCSIVIVFALFGSEIITAWLGESFAWIGMIVTITVMGIVFNGIQTTNYRLVLGGSASIAPIALSAVVITVVASMGTLLGTVYGGWSLLEVALLITLARLLRNFFYLAIYFSRRLNYSIVDYAWRVQVKPLLMGLSVICFFHIIKWQIPFSLVNIPALVLSSLLVACVYLSLCWKFVLHDDIKNSVLKLVASKFVKAGSNAK